jgi:hypothetical protein
MIERNRVGERCGVGIVLVVGSGVVEAEAAAVSHLPGSPGNGAAAAVLGDRLLVFIVWALALAGERGDLYRRSRGGAAARPARRGWTEEATDLDTQTWPSPSRFESRSGTINPRPSIGSINDQNQTSLLAN